MIYLLYIVKYNESQERLKVLEKPGKQEVELVEGSGLRMAHEDLEKNKFMAKTPAHLARLLFREFFTLETLATHCLFKRPNKRSDDQDPDDEEELPELDPHKRNTIFGIKIYY